MLKMDDLQEERADVAYKVEKGVNVTLSNIQELIQKVADEYQIPVAFGEGQIKSGGMFNKTVSDCITMWHPDHPTDYFRNAITLRKQGLMNYVSIFYFGKSKQLGNQISADMAGEYLREGKLGRAALTGIMSIGKNKQKHQEENDYYHALKEVFNEAFG